MPDSHTALRDAALAYAAHGWKVIPLHHPVETGEHPVCSCAKGATCGKNTGKHPLWEDWTTLATTDALKIERWWTVDPQANIGIVPGNGLVCLDIDPRNGGDVQLEELQQTYTTLPETVLAQTGGGGEHRLFTTDVDLPSMKLTHGIDFLADGHHQFVAAPSLHLSGRRYTWELSSHPDDVEVAPLPDWLVALVQSEAKARVVAAATLPDVLPAVDVATLRVSARMHRVIREGNDTQKPYPSRSEALFAVLVALVAHGYTDGEIAAVVLDPAQGISEKPLSQKNSKSPHYWEQTRGWIAKEIARARASTIVREAPGAPPTEGAERPLPYSDYTNALAFVQDHGAVVRYCHSWGKWLCWTGTHWEIDESGQVLRYAKATVKRLARQVEYLEEKEQISALMRHIKASLAMGKLSALVQCAQSEEGIPVAPGALNQHPWLLNCRNGTVDLQTGTLRPHAQEDLLTQCLAVDYDPQAVCPRWERFLGTIMRDDAALIRFLQKAVGYALTGCTTEQALFVLYGKGANGKSTFMGTILTLLGAYAMKASSDLLLLTPHANHPTEIASLFGKRCVAAMETPENARMNEALIKELTGGDTMQARRLYEDFWQFIPTHTIFLATNHRPEVRGTDTAIWRRIKLIPFEVSIPTAEQDKTLAQKLQEEFSGILRWAVDGCLAWQREELSPPDQVQQATNIYQSDMDTLGTFLMERCFLDAQVQSRSSHLYEAYKQWATAAGEYVVSQKKFGQNLTERGIVRYTNNGTWYRGITLITREDQDDTDGHRGISRGISREISKNVPSVASIVPSSQPIEFNSNGRDTEETTQLSDIFQLTFPRVTTLSENPLYPSVSFRDPSVEGIEQESCQNCGASRWQTGVEPWRCMGCGQRKGRGE